MSDQSPAKKGGKKSKPTKAAQPEESPEPKVVAAATAKADGGAKLVPRVVSLIVLVAVVLIVTVMFFRVMAQFIAPLFLAGVLVVVFEPLHKWVLSRVTDKPAWAALVTTSLVALIVIIPIAWLGLNAFLELSTVVDPFLHPDKTAAAGEAPPDQVGEAFGRLQERFQPYIDWYEETSGQNLLEQLRAAAQEIGETILASGVHTVVAAFGFFFGLGIMAFAMYYFLADGPAMVAGLMKLSPLDDEYEHQLLEKFAEVSRAVVIATLASAAAQGLMAGVGYYFALDGGPIFLLTAVTMVMAIVPFVGATIVWVPVVLWVYLYQGDTAWAIGLLLWCAIAVSNIDNIIKPLVLHGQSNLHPLLALLSVLGGVTAMGPVGILVGPMLVAFLQSLLNMLRKELDDLKGEAPPLAASAGEATG